MHSRSARLRLPLTQELSEAGAHQKPICHSIMCTLLCPGAVLGSQRAVLTELGEDLLSADSTPWSRLLPGGWGLGTAGGGVTKCSSDFTMSCSAALGHLLSSFRPEQWGGGGPRSQGRTQGMRGGEIPQTRERSVVGIWGSWRGRGSPTPTPGFMMSDSARAFPSLGQRPIESRVGLERLGPGEERGLVLGLWWWWLG